MLAARCTADLARLAFPDVVKGLGYLAEDTDDAGVMEALGPAEVEAPTKARKAVQRRTKPRKAVEPRTVPVEPWGDDQPLPVRPLDPDAPVYEDADLPTPHLDPPPPSAMPDPEPEPAAVEPPADANPRPEPREDAAPVAPPKGPGPQLLRALHASLGRALGRSPDTAVDRDQRLLLTSAMVGREVTSTKELTRTEAMRALDVLAAIQAGEATWEEDDQGHLVILDLRTPPDDQATP
jgi:hypothetical protein